MLKRCSRPRHRDGGPTRGRSKSSTASSRSFDEEARVPPGPRGHPESNHRRTWRSRPALRPRLGPCRKQIRRRPTWGAAALGHEQNRNAAPFRLVAERAALSGSAPANEERVPASTPLDGEAACSAFRPSPSLESSWRKTRLRRRAACDRRAAGPRPSRR